MISVVIPLYNKKDTVMRAVCSVLNQTMQDFEIVVVDDGSTDGGADVIMDGVKPEIKEKIHIVRQDNRGVSAARNRGIKEAQSELITFLDADDEWDKNYLETVTDLERRYPECAAFATAYRTGTAAKTPQECTKPVSTIHHSPFTIHHINKDNYFLLSAKSAPLFHCNSIMIRKEALLAVGGFPKGVYQGEDLLTWARLAARFTIAYSPIPCCTFHTGATWRMGIPKRVPPDIDIVGNELAALYASHPDTPGLQQYVALWHKMRASIYLRLPKRGSQCRYEIKKSIEFYPKVRLYRLLLLLPYSIRIKLLSLH